MENKIIGELFGINIHSPIIRSEVREVLKKQLEFKNILMSEDKLSEDQAFLEIADIFESFFSNISEIDKESFEKIHSEEIGAAPKEWFNQPDVGNNSIFIENGNAGDLFGIQVTYPFTRENIRKIVSTRTDLMKSMADTKGISLYQASNDLEDIQSKFIEKLSPNDQENFLTIMTEELIAHSNAINDQTNRINQEVIKSEISNQNLTQIMGTIILFGCLLFLFFIFFK